MYMSVSKVCVYVVVCCWQKEIAVNEVIEIDLMQRKYREDEVETSLLVHFHIHVYKYMYTTCIYAG